MARNFAFVRTAIAFVAVLAVVTACGGGGVGGSSPDENVPHPLVRQFSPTMSPIDLTSGSASPTYTDSFLTVNTEPAYPGKICIFFQTGTKIDPKSVFVAGNPTLGIDLSSLQITRWVVGTGHVPLDPAPDGVQVLDDRIIFTPALVASGAGLPDGQYSIGVFANLKSVEGDPVDKAPAFHSFTVGAADTIAPEVVVTDPVNTQTGVGAGVPPPQPPPGVTGVADVRTTIFGPTSPDITIRFNEGIDAATVTPGNIRVVAASVPGLPAIAPAPGFPKLKSALDASSLPSNGFEIVWRADPVAGGLPFGAQIQVTCVGGASGALADRSGNILAANYVFQFQTIAPPSLPNNPEPEYGIVWSASDRIGVLDTINQKEIAQWYLGIQTTEPVRNVIPQYTDTICTKNTLGLSFDPLEISVDARTDGLSCHTFWYVQSRQSGEVVIVNSRTSLPAAIINTPSPGGLSNQTGGGQAANVLIVTNESANTFTVFNIANITTGRPFLTGPIYITQVNPTGNTPRAIAITAPSTGAFNREFFSAGPGTPMIMYVDYTDGVVNTANLGATEPIRQMALGATSSPNDVVFTPCFGTNPIMFAAITQGGLPGEGKVAYYIAGPGCVTGTSTSARPDALVGDLSGFDAPAGLDNVLPYSPNPFFAMAESGSTKNQVVTLGVQTGAFTFPQIVRQFGTGPNPVAIAHRTSWFSIRQRGFMCNLAAPGCPTLPVAYAPPPCQYYGTEQYPVAIDGSGASSLPMYVCVRGASRIEVLDLSSGAPDFYSPVVVPGIRGVYAPGSQ